MRICRSTPTSTYSLPADGFCDWMSTDSWIRRRASSAFSVVFCCDGDLLAACVDREPAIGEAVEELDMVGLGVAMPIWRRRWEKAASVIGFGSMASCLMAVGPRVSECRAQLVQHDSEIKGEEAHRHSCSGKLSAKRHGDHRWPCLLLWDSGGLLRPGG